MPLTITAERPDTSDAIALVHELQTHLESFYPPESRHGFSVERLVAEDVAFFVLRVAGVAAGCGGILLMGKENSGRGGRGRPAVGNGGGSGDPRTATTDGEGSAGAYGEIKRMYVRPAHRGAGY